MKVEKASAFVLPPGPMRMDFCSLSHPIPYHLFPSTWFGTLKARCSYNYDKNFQPASVQLWFIFRFLWALYFRFLFREISDYHDKPQPPKQRASTKRRVIAVSWKVSPDPDSDPNPTPVENNFVLMESVISILGNWCSGVTFKFRKEMRSHLYAGVSFG